MGIRLQCAVQVQVEVPGAGIHMRRESFLGEKPKLEQEKNLSQTSHFIPADKPEGRGNLAVRSRKRREKERRSGKKMRGDIRGSTRTSFR